MGLIGLLGYWVDGTGTSLKYNSEISWFNVKQHCVRRALVKWGLHCGIVGQLYIFILCKGRRFAHLTVMSMVTAGFVSDRANSMC